MTKAKNFIGLLIISNLVIWATVILLICFMRWDVEVFRLLYSDSYLALFLAKYFFLVSVVFTIAVKLDRR